MMNTRGTSPTFRHALAAGSLLTLFALAVRPAEGSTLGPCDTASSNDAVCIDALDPNNITVLWSHALAFSLNGGPQVSGGGEVTGLSGPISFFFVSNDSVPGSANTLFTDGVGLLGSASDPATGPYDGILTTEWIVPVASCGCDDTEFTSEFRVGTALTPADPPDLFLTLGYTYVEDGTYQWVVGNNPDLGEAASSTLDIYVAATPETTSTAPEPASLVLVGGSLVSLAAGCGFRRRRTALGAWRRWYLDWAGVCGIVK